MPRLFLTFGLLILTFFNFSASAQEGQFGSWNVGLIVNNEGLYAATINDSKAILGQYCYSEEEICYWLLVNELGCEDGSRYPVLINSDIGASNLKVICVKLGGKPRYAFTNFEDIDKAIKASSKLGIAFPLQGGFFQVNRFSTDGAINAISSMREAAGVAFSMKKKRSTRDIRL